MGISVKIAKRKDFKFASLNKQTTRDTDQNARLKENSCLDCHGTPFCTPLVHFKNNTHNPVVIS